MKIKPHKGGRGERLYARCTKKTKVKLFARVKREGFSSLADWLEAQATAGMEKTAHSNPQSAVVELSESEIKSLYSYVQISESEGYDEDEARNALRKISEIFQRK